MTYFLRSGDTFRVTSEAALDIHKALPAGNFVIKQDPRTMELYLEQIESFTKIGKVYGNSLQRADRIMNTYKDRTASTGILLAGEKGSGKTLLAKTLSIMGQEQGMPTIVINQPWHGDAFNQLIQAISQPCIVLFDEFEKVYDSEQQESILTLLDGVFPSKKMFILTCNDQWRIDSHMRNRPGRIFYMLDFKGLDTDFIKEYCEDRLENKAHIDGVVKVSVMFSQFNFDMLKALVEEMNRYKEDAFTAMEMLNAKPTSDSGQYKVKVSVAGVEAPESSVWPQTWNNSPLGQEQITVQYELPQPGKKDVDEDDYDDNTVTVIMRQHHLKRLDEKTGSFVYVNEDGVMVTFERVKTTEHNYRHLAF